MSTEQKFGRNASYPQYIMQSLFLLSPVDPILDTDCGVLQSEETPTKLSWFILGSDMVWELLLLPFLIAEICCSCKQLKLALNPEVILPCSPQPLKFQPRSVKGVNLLFFCFFLGCTILLSPPSLFLYSLTKCPRQCHILSFLLLKCLTAVMVGDCSRQDKPRVLWEDNYSLCYVSD